MQLYKCMACGRQFRSGQKITDSCLWEKYLHGKQTVAGISAQTGLSPSTITRRLRKIKIEPPRPTEKGLGVVHMDVTYFGRNTGVLLALEAGTGRLLHVRHVAHEHVDDYVEALRSIEANGYRVAGVVLDGNRPLFKALEEYPIQMCQFHMVAILRRKLTKNPQLPAGCELLNLAYRLKRMTGEEFRQEFYQWKAKWHDFLTEKTTSALTGKTVYTHQRLRSAMTSVSTYMKWLFTFEGVPGMPNTNNLVEGTFTLLKRALRNHPGARPANRRRLIDGFFKAYAELHKAKGGGH